MNPELNFLRKYIEFNRSILESLPIVIDKEGKQTIGHLIKTVFPPADDIIKMVEVTPAHQVMIRQKIIRPIIEFLNQYKEDVEKCSKK